MQVNLSQSIEEIENDYWQDYDFETNLIEKCHQLRKIPICKLSVENLRMLIGQNIGNAILIPLAIERIKKNPMIEGDLYEGDLLEVVLKSDEDYWKQNPIQYFAVVKVLLANSDYIENFDTTDEIHSAISIATLHFQRMKDFF